MEQTDSDPAARAYWAYGGAIAAMKALLADGGASRPEAGRSLLAVIARFAALLNEDNQGLLALALRSSPGNYLYAHCVNVSILAVRLATALQWDLDSVMRLGLAAILHGSGMNRWMGLAQERRRLSAAELQKLKGYAQDSVKVLEQIPGIEPRTREAVAALIGAVHDPKEPQDLGPIARQSAEVIALCEAYEALSHPRAWRQALLPHEAVKAVLKFPRDDHDPELIRTFVSQLTPYPPGTYVRLEGGEVGRVVRVAPDSPTRPILRLFLNAGGKRVRVPWFVDLKQQPLMHIEAAVDEADLDVDDARLRAMFLADRWWGADAAR